MKTYEGETQESLLEQLEYCNHRLSLNYLAEWELKEYRWLKKDLEKKLKHFEL